MKKHLASVACALALALTALPTSALAVNNPSAHRVYDQDTYATSGVVLDASANAGSWIDVKATDAQASNTTLGANDSVVASFQITGDASDLTITLKLGSYYAGASGKVFVQHDDGATDVVPFTLDASGNTSFHIDRLSIYTVVIDTTTIKKASGTTVDTSAKSPFTGVSSNGIVIVSGIALAAAGCCAVAARKND